MDGGRIVELSAPKYVLANMLELACQWKSNRRPRRMGVHLRNDPARREKRLGGVDRAIRLCCVDNLV